MLLSGDTAVSGMMAVVVLGGGDCGEPLDDAMQ